MVFQHVETSPANVSIVLIAANGSDLFHKLVCNLFATTFLGFGQSRLDIPYNYIPYIYPIYCRGSMADIH
jgi:hypothetical protein